MLTYYITNIAHFFSIGQDLWPDHCVVGTEGADFHTRSGGIFSATATDSIGSAVASLSFMLVRADPCIGYTVTERDQFRC